MATPRFGVDYSTSRPGAAALKAAGYSFVCRYLAGKTAGKALTKAEADALRAGGIDLVSNWEVAAQAALNGRTQGVADAKAAAAAHLADGGPPGRPIYFSADWDASEAQQPAINAYFAGVASVIGLSRTGAYGGYWVIKRLFDAGLIKWGWQTYAWSGGHWDTRAQLRQVKNGIHVAGQDADKDEAETLDFGQWGYTPPTTEVDVTPEEHDWLKEVYGAMFLGGGSMGPAVPAADRGPDSVTGNSLVDLAQHTRKAVDGIGAAPAIDLDALAGKVADKLIASNTNGLSEADHAAIVADVKAALRAGTGS